ncbi:MAG: LacI family transcriptional regulator [Candidatus Omnitrophica bacterium]|nr:LacI family transcriptional regulator [Candidatus Omnitrophota bacterium]
MERLDTKNKKWQSIYDEIKFKIGSGDYESGTIKIKDIIQKFSVSDITARRVLNELKKDGLVHSIRRKGTIILGKEKIKDIYLIVKDENLIYKSPLNTQIFTRIVNGFNASNFSKLFRKHIISLDFLLSNKEQFKEKDIIIFAEALLKVEKDKVEIDNEKIEQIKEFTPIIIHAFGKIEDLNVVGTDYYSGFFNAVRYLFKNGCRKIGFITGNINVCWYYPRFSGYIDGLKECGLEIIPELIKVTSGENPEEEKKAMEEMIKIKPDAIICANDYRAIRVLEWCNENKIKVPDDISIIGFDNINETKFTNPPLTTIDSKLELYGETVFKLFMKRKNNERVVDVFIKPEIIERESVKGVKL